MVNKIIKIFDECLEKYPLFIRTEGGIQFIRNDQIPEVLNPSAYIKDRVVIIFGNTAKLTLNVDEYGGVLEIHNQKLDLSKDFCIELYKLNIDIQDDRYDRVSIMRENTINELEND